MRLTWREIVHVYFREDAESKGKRNQKTQAPSIVSQKQQWMSVGYYRCTYDPETGIVRHMTVAELDSAFGEHLIMAKERKLAMRKERHRKTIEARRQNYARNRR